jgi:hypothetical protein
LPWGTLKGLSNEERALEGRALKTGAHDARNVIAGWAD